ncbi:hypothetical protein [Desulfosporosinus shakirovi]|uniref:hypothetical protein n=1 Tax=Desulfosporosinus shakirovi TaxID=2885154 RepID=UPI001E310291|nr:hypothetical protein [Desulfosporosinus sp. SRJS8]MCB8815366.1 hypothetical protein [Desulfosporosinus sp. SRJS8]
MGDFIDGLKRGKNAIQQAMDRRGEFRAGGKQVVCPHCSNGLFEKGEAQMNTQGATFLGLDWLNKSASLLVCTNCGLIQWFIIQPEKNQKS